MTNQMNWNNDRYQYEYELENGDLLTVDGDEFAESVQDAVKSGQDYDEATNELLEPTQWEALAGDNPNVEIVKK